MSNPELIRISVRALPGPATSTGSTPTDAPAATLNNESSSVVSAQAQAQAPSVEIELELSATQTVGAAKEMVRARDLSIAVDKLCIGGTAVDDSATLASLVAQYREPLVFTAERRTLEVSAGPVKRRPRCQFTGCTSAPLRGVGHCASCDLNFCSRHRLMEQHKCEQLAGRKQQLHERNALRLQEQQTVASKV